MHNNYITNRYLIWDLIVSIFIITLFSPASVLGYNLTTQEYGDPLYRKLNSWISVSGLNHAALFAGVNSIGTYKVIEVASGNGVQENTRDSMVADPWYGSYNLSNDTGPNSFSERKAIMDVAIQLDGYDPSYPLFGHDAINPVSNWGSIISPSEIDELRCDGLVEYAYEYKDFEIWGKNGSHYDISIYPEEHNNLYDTIYPNNACTELAPLVQRGGGTGGTCTNLTRAATVDNPTLQVNVTKYISKTDVTIRVSDQSGVHKIRYKWGSGGVEQAAVYSQHPTQDYQEISTSTTSDQQLYLWAQDGGGNHDGLWHIYTISVKTLSSISINGASSVNENSTSSYTATAYWSDDTSSTVTPSWGENSPYSTISNGGTLTTTTVTSNKTVSVSASYTAGGITKTAMKSITILNSSKILNGLTISGSTSVNEDSSASYTAAATFDDGSTSNVTSSASWSENSNYSEINGGLLTTSSVTSNQPITITASYTYGGVTKSDTHNVAILNSSKILTGLTISGQTPVNGNSSESYTATATFDDGSTSNVTSSTNWTENSAYATINSGGILTTTDVTSNHLITVSASYTSGSVTKTDTHSVTIIPKVATPTISPNGGEFLGSVQVTLACSTPDAAIRYTTDNTNPTASSTLYTGNPFTVNSFPTEVRARGFKNNYTESEVAADVFWQEHAPTILNMSNTNHGLEIRFNYTANIPNKRVIGYRLYKEGYPACEAVQTDSQTNPKTVTCTIQSESGTYPFTLSVLFKDLESFQFSEGPQSGPFMFTLAKMGDINYDDTADLLDAILSLQMLTQIDIQSNIHLYGDVNRDGKIGMPEAIYALRDSAGLICQAQVGNGDATFSWTASPEPITGYNLYYKTGTSGEPYAGTGLTEGDSPIPVDKTATTYTVTGLSGDDTYYFVLTALNGDEEGEYSKEITWDPNCRLLIMDFGSIPIP